LSETDSVLQKRLIVDINKCTGCRSCVLACSFTKERVFNPELARIMVLKFETAGVDAPLFCQQCEEPRCVEACSRDAIVRQPESGILVIDAAACDGCGICLVACPYAAIFKSPGETKKEDRILKCDLCGGTPECVDWCETAALQYVDATETELIREARENLVLVRKRFEIEEGTPLWRTYGRRIEAGKAGEGS